LLNDGQEWIGDSTEIAFYLDAKYTLRPLLPSDPMLRSKAIMIENKRIKLVCMCVVLFIVIYCQVNEVIWMNMGWLMRQGI
jgi:hypothetical protein